MQNQSQTQLKRSLGLTALTIYGVGDILGAGVYALIGKVAGILGNACWVAFLTAFFVAALTGLSYAELGSRYPRSAGAAYFSLHALKIPWISYCVGFLVVMSGIVSMATVSRGFAGYLHAVLPDVYEPAVILIFFSVLGLINFWGIRESSFTNMVCTVVEVAGLLLIIWIGSRFFGSVNFLAFPPAVKTEGLSALFFILPAGILAFYAFIGFEDMVNVAEEAKNPERNLPWAIVLSIGITTVIYILTALAAVSAVSYEVLGQSSAPLLEVVKQSPVPIPGLLFTAVALFAISNTALLNFIMGSRLIYGMSREGLLPPFFGKVHPSRKTPHVAILLVGIIAVIFSLTGTLTILAGVTSTLLLIAFSIVHVSLFVIKRKDREARPAFRIPLIVPVLGALSTLALLSHAPLQSLIIAGILIVIALGLFGFQKLSKRVIPRSVATKESHQ
jgi:amino acid transporter